MRGLAQTEIGAHAVATIAATYVYLDDCRQRVDAEVLEVVIVRLQQLGRAHRRLIQNPSFRV
jgi:hypothetical protein